MMSTSQSLESVNMLCLWQGETEVVDGFRVANQLTMSQELYFGLSPGQPNVIRRVSEKERQWEEYKNQSDLMWKLNLSLLTWEVEDRGHEFKEY